MSKGAKPGQNRFADSQKIKQDYRIARIKEEVIPKLKAFAGKTSFAGVTPFSKFCAEIYNNDLPINEKKMGYRTLVQNSDYWGLIGPIYYRYWDPTSDIASKKDKHVGKLAMRRADQLQAETEKLKMENDALRSALRNHGASPATLPNPQQIDQGFMLKFDKVCRALKLVLDASDGMFTIDMKAKKICCMFNDLEPLEGLVPADLVDPFIFWMKEKEADHDGQ